MKEDYKKLKHKYDDACKKHTDFEVQISVHVEKYQALEVTQQTWEADYHREHKAYEGLLLKLEETREQLAIAQKDDADDDAQIASLKEQVRVLQGKYDEEYRRAEKYEDELTALKMENKNLGEKIEELEIEVKCSKDSAKALREQVDDLEDGHDQLKKKNRNLSRDLEIAKEESTKWELKYKKAIADDQNDDEKIKEL